MKSILFSINENIGVLRAILFPLLIVAIVGPWAFDRIHVPAEFPCSAPFIRLEGDFCGTPLLGIYLIVGYIAGFPTFVLESLSGGVNLITLSRALIPFLLLLPLFTTFLFLLNREGRSLRSFHLIALFLATGVGFLAANSRNSLFNWVLWGMWMYFGLVALLFVLEILAFALGRRFRQGD